MRVVPARYYLVDDTPDEEPYFLTVAADVSNAAVGVPFSFRFRYGGNPRPLIEIEGYDPAASSIAQDGRWSVPAPVAGTYSMTASLRRFGVDGPGDVVASLSFTWSVAAAQINASIESTTLATVLYGDGNPLIPLTLAGTGPFVLDLAAGDLSDRPKLITRSLSAAEAAVTAFEGAATLEGAGASITIGVTGATGVRSTKVFAAGITVNRHPQFVGLISLPTFPVNTPDTWSFLPFVRAYPAAAVTKTAGASFPTNMSLASSVITFGDLTAAAGSATADMEFTADNGDGFPATFTGRVNVAAAGAGGNQAPGVVFALTQAGYSASDNAVVATINDIAQGAALALKATEGRPATTEGARWDNTNRAFKLRDGASDTLGSLGSLGVDADLFPCAVGMRVKVLGSTQTGARVLFGSTGQFGYVNKGTGAASAAPTFEGKVEAVKSGTRSSDTINYSPASAIRALTVSCGHGSTATDRITGITVSNGGTPVAMTRAVTAVDSASETGRTYIYFLGAAIPTGALTLTISYDTSIGTSISYSVQGWTASGDCEVVNSQKVEGDATDPSVTLVTGGRECIATGVIWSGHDAEASITANANMTAVDTNDFGAHTIRQDRQTTKSTSNFVFSYTAAAEDCAMCAIAISEINANTTLLGIGNSAIGWSADVGAIADTWVSIIFNPITQTTGKIRVGATTYSVTASNCSGRLNDFSLNGATGVDMDLRALRIWRGTFDIEGADGNAMITWLDAQDPAATPPTPPPPPPAPATVLTDTDSRMALIINPDRTFAWHDSSIKCVTSYTQADKQFNTIPETGLTVDATRKVVTKVVGLGGKNYFRIQICDNIPPYTQSAPSRRFTPGGGYNAQIQPGASWWYGFSFVVDGSLYEDMGGRFDCSVMGLHDRVTAPHPSLTPFSGFLDPVGESSLNLRFILRRHTLESAPTNSTEFTERLRILASVVKAKKYDVAINFALGYLNSHNPRWIAWVRVDGTYLNSGNPVVADFERLGYNLSPYTHEMRTLGLYNWRAKTNNVDAWPDAANGIIVAGDKGWSVDVHRSFCIPGTAGAGAEPVVNRDTVMGLLD